MHDRIVALADLVWSTDSIGGILVLTLLMGTGVYLTARLGLPQVRCLARAVRLFARRGHEATPEGPAPRSAPGHPLFGAVGVGAVAGVTTAIWAGGPGAVFWLWVTGALAMATRLAETALATHFGRDRTDSGSGPMASMAAGLSRRLAWLGGAFAALAALAAFGIGNMVPANTVSENVRAALGSIFGLSVPVWATGAAMAALLAVVVLGGQKSVGRAVARAVPFAAAVYVLGAFVVIAVHVRELPAALAAIMGSAFGGTAAAGGFVGATVMEAVRWGVARGTFSSEAGLGTSAIVPPPRGNEPAREGLMAMLAPTVDTLGLCTVTALAVLCTGAWHEQSDQALRLENVVVYERPVTSPAQAAEPTNLFSGVVRVVHGELRGTVFFFQDRSPVEVAEVWLDGEQWGGALHVVDGRVRQSLAESAERGLVPMRTADARRLELRGRTLASGPVLAANAFGDSIPYGSLVVTLVLLIFALATAVSWCERGESCVQFLLGRRAALPYRLVFVAAHFLGPLVAARAVWAAADVANAAVALPNIMGLWALAPLAAGLLRSEPSPQKAGKRPRRKPGRPKRR